MNSKISSIISNQKLRNILFLICLFSFIELKSQSWGEILVDKTEILHPDTVWNWSSEQFQLLLESDSILNLHFFKFDSSALVGLKKFIDSVKGPYNPHGYDGQFIGTVTLYLRFHDKYPNNNIDSIIHLIKQDPYGFESYLKFHSVQFDTIQMESFISDTSIPIYNRLIAYSNLFGLSDSSYLSRKYHRNIHFINENPHYFLGILSSFRITTDGKVPADMVVEQQRYLTLFDTTKKEYRDEFLRFFFNIHSPEVQAYIDEQNRIRKAFIDSLLFADSVALELAMWSEPFILSPEDSVRWQRLSDTSLVEYLEQSQPYSYDDGKRFDIFSNAELIHFLDTMSFSVTYPPDTPYVYGFRANAQQLHLHKVCQILGDRKAYGSLEPDSLQQSILDRFIDTLMVYGNMQEDLKISIPKNREAGKLATRLGRLAIPRFMEYLIYAPHDKWSWIIRPSEIFRQITESDLTLFISKADQLFSVGDTLAANDIGTYLYINLSKEVYVDPDQRRPRRPVAPTEERQRWADEHIWPLLLRMNHWYTRR